MSKAFKLYDDFRQLGEDDRSHIMDIASSLAIRQLQRPHPDAALIELAKTFEARWHEESKLWDKYQGRVDEEAENFIDAAHKRTKPVALAILSIPAATLDGLLAKIRVIQWCHVGTEAAGGVEIDNLITGSYATDVKAGRSILSDLVSLCNNRRAQKDATMKKVYRKTMRLRSMKTGATQSFYARH
ncbi:hypothetical protein [Filomicrobium sp.]|uniref:hypothetical protein n=1 Tax=Filomicrobium sp. TaxID=2024831 RepID=UPI00258267F6|nr:hypothetical protein [Filomicrobium sp.]MCV0371703.1 hypothetical protein [Filomicrobium sp.]